MIRTTRRLFAVAFVVAVAALSLHAKGGSDMATLNDLVGQIENAALRERIEEEIKRVVKQKKFGLVFEEHLPECTPLWEIPVKRGSLVAKKDGKMDDVWRVAKIKDGKAICVRDVTAGETNAVEFELSDIVTVARFGEPIYPFLKPLGSVTNAPDNDLWHALIEADNYHALQFLEYIYGGKVDCIYIDPPYNTGSKDSKYNNNNVDDLASSIYGLSDGDVIRKQDKKFEQLEREYEEKLEEDKKKEELKIEYEKEANIAKMNLPEEPAESDSEACYIKFRLPDGEKVIERRFLKSNKIQILFDFIKSNGNEIFSEPDSNNFTIIYMGFPRNNLEDKKNNTLEKEGLFPNAMLQIEENKKISK